MTARLVTWLALVACLQLAVAAGLLWPDSSPGADTAQGEAALLALPRDELARIDVADARGNAVSLVRREGQWIIEEGALPATASAIDRLLDALASPAGFPVAGSEGARKRFEVETGHFQRRITLEGTGATADSAGSAAVNAATIYLGTAPDMRRVHARRGDSDAIQAIALSTFDVPATTDGWLDPSLLSRDSIERVAIADRAWEKVDGQWRIADTPTAADPAHAGSLESLQQVLRTLQVTGVVPSGQTSDLSAQPASKLVVSGGTGPVTLRFAPMGDGEDARLYSSRFKRWFTLSAYDRDRFADALAGLT